MVTAGCMFVACVEIRHLNGGFSLSFMYMCETNYNFMPSRAI